MVINFNNSFNKHAIKWPILLSFNLTTINRQNIFHQNREELLGCQTLVSNDIVLPSSMDITTSLDGLKFNLSIF